MYVEPFNIDVKIELTFDDYTDMYRSSLLKTPLLKRMIVDFDSLNIAERTVYWFYNGKKLEQTADELGKLIIDYRKEIKYG